MVVSDSGFDYEAEPVVRHFGAEHTFLVRLYRSGCDFKGDSRGYISLSHLGVREIEYQNQSGVDVLARFGHHLLRVAGLPRETVDTDSNVKESDESYQRRISEDWTLLLARHHDEERQWAERQAAQYNGV